MQIKFKSPKSLKPISSKRVLRSNRVFSANHPLKSRFYTIDDFKIIYESFRRIGFWSPQNGDYIKEHYEDKLKFPFFPKKHYLIFKLASKNWRSAVRQPVTKDIQKVKVFTRFSRKFPSLSSNFSLGMLVSQLRVGQVHKKNSTKIPFSKFNSQILYFLYQKGFIGSYGLVCRGKAKYFNVFLKYYSTGEPFLYNFYLHSKPSNYKYLSFNQALAASRGALQSRYVLFSTRNGICSLDDLIRFGIGGKILFSFIFLLYNFKK